MLMVIAITSKPYDVFQIHVQLEGCYGNADLISKRWS